MAKNNLVKYKVWVEIERVNELDDTYEGVSAFPVCIGTFGTVEEADAAIVELTGKSTQ
jgi:hypothetical protein